MNTAMNFYMPTKVIMGIGCIKENKNIFTALGKKALLVTGRNSAKKNGSQKDITEVLDSLEIAYVVYDQVMSNPTIDCAYEGARIAKEFGAEFVISIGGGSPMDAGKAIALLAAQEVSRENLFSGQYEEKVLPMVHVPTTAGTGSEVTPYAILTNDAAQTKTSIASPVIFPTVAFLDPTYMMSLGQTSTINTAVDALSHAVEGMLSIKATDITNALAVESIEKIVACYDAMKSNTLTIEQRGELLYASMVAGIVIAHTGTTAVHSMGYSLTYFKDIDHGRANGLLMADFFRFVAKEKPEEIKKVLDAMKLESIEAFESWMDSLLGEKEAITEEEIKQYAEISMRAKNIPNCKVVPTLEDLIEVYQQSFQ